MVGFSRTPMTDEQYREAMLAALRERAGEGKSVRPDDPLVQRPALPSRATTTTRRRSRR